MLAHAIPMQDNNPSMTSDYFFVDWLRYRLTLVVCHTHEEILTLK
jgi:hypothetical protein